MLQYLLLICCYPKISNTVCNWIGKQRLLDALIIRWIPVVFVVIMYYFVLFFCWVNIPKLGKACVNGEFGIAIKILVFCAIWHRDVLITSSAIPEDFLYFWRRPGISENFFRIMSIRQTTKMFLTFLVTIVSDSYESELMDVIVWNVLQWVYTLCIVVDHPRALEFNPDRKPSLYVKYMLTIMGENKEHDNEDDGHQRGKLEA